MSRASLSRGDDHGSVRNLPSARHVVGVHHRTAHLGRIFSPDLPTSRRVFAALFELHFVTFVGLGLIGLLILLCTVNIDAEGRVLLPVQLRLAYSTSFFEPATTPHLPSAHTESSPHVGAYRRRRVHYSEPHFRIRLCAAVHGREHAMNMQTRRSPSSSRFHRGCLSRGGNWRHRVGRTPVSHLRRNIFGVCLAALRVNAARAQTIPGALPEPTAALGRGEWPAYGAPVIRR